MNEFLLEQEKMILVKLEVLEWRQTDWNVSL